MVTLGPGQERYLEHALESVRRQTYRTSGQLVLRWGPGEDLTDLASARNHALSAAAGDFVRLLEASDSLPWHSTALLVRALRASTYGTAAGRSERLDGDWRSVAFTPAPGTDSGLADRLIDVARWRATGLSWRPEHGHFGDAVLAEADAVLGCASIDEVVHEDHDRALGLPFGHLRQWSLEAEAWLCAMEAALTGARTGWADAVVDRRLPAFLGDVESLDGSQWHRLVEIARRLTTHAGGHARAESRILCWLTANDRRAELTDLVLRRWRADDDLPTVVHDGQVFANLGVDVPAAVRRLSAVETPLVLRPVRRAHDRLELVGFIRGVETRRPPHVRATYHGSAVDVRASETPAATRVAAEAEHCHDAAWLSIDLTGAMPQGSLHVELTNQGITRVGEVAVPRSLVPPPSEDPRGDDEIGPYAQRQLQRWYAGEHQIDPRLAYFQAYTGQSATDSPLAIYEAMLRQRPDLRAVWLVEHPGVAVPEGAEPVLFHSRDWYRTLATARWVVTNIEMERWFRRKPGQSLVQTWHGNPGKSMGLTAWRRAGLTPGRIEQTLDHGPRNWTLLVSPSPVMTDFYRREFDYYGPVEERGYPRDDALVVPEAAQQRAKARAHFGLAEGDRVVLYAPTWRDAYATNYRRARLHDGFDIAHAAEQLGEGYVIMLRGHRFHRDRELGGARVLDVTEHPEVNDVILAADAAVLDYSSIRFDFALTGRPMVFHVPDLEDYSVARGFLYDFTESAPGPLLASTDEVIEALRDLPGLTARFAAERAEFNARFNGFQDGHAADRVAIALLGGEALGD